MKDHHCTRFQQTGSLQLIGFTSITINGQKRQESTHADTVQLTCVKCGATRSVERKQVQKSGKVLLLKTEGP